MGIKIVIFELLDKTKRADILSALFYIMRT